MTGGIASIGYFDINGEKYGANRHNSLIVRTAENDGILAVRLSRTAVLTEKAFILLILRWKGGNSPTEGGCNAPFPAFYPGLGN